MVSALREWMAELGKRANVAVSWIGKVKTIVQMTAITALLAFTPEFKVSGNIILSAPFLAAYILLYVAMVLTLWSGFIYLRAAWPDLKASG